MESPSQNFSAVDFPPQHRLSDYAEITALSLMVFAGCPLNVFALYRSLKRFAKMQERSPSYSPSRRRLSEQIGRHVAESLNTSRSSRIFALILHLTAANLMVLLIYGLTQIGWLVTYAWEAGDLTCKMLKFLHALCFYGTSNLMVAVAVERLYIAINLNQPRSTASIGCDFLRLLPWFGWILATISSIPQFFLWYTITPYPDVFPEWHQCVDVWTASADPEAGKSLTEKIYVGVHLSLVFWLPVLVIVMCYVVIIARLDSKLKRTYRDWHKSKRQSDAARYRKRAENWHRASCSLDEGSENNQRRHSVILLMEMPIVVETPLAFSMPPEKRATLHETGAILITTLTRARKSAVTKMSCVLAAYMICWAPYNIMTLLRYSDPERYNDSGMEYFYNLIVLNAVINPILYGC